MNERRSNTSHSTVLRFPRGWPEFHSFEDFENAPPITFAIDRFLQNEGATLFGGLPGHGKTLILLSIVKALLSGNKLWGYFEVATAAKRVLYLTPEVSISPFKHRLKLFDLYQYLENGKLLVRTLSYGTTPDLSDKDILAAAKGAHVFLDSAIRFVEGKESDATDNQRGLAKRIFGLLSARARTVVGAHHSPKASGNADTMTLENMLRGTGDIGAMLTAAFGVKQLDPRLNIIHIESVKSRDLEPCPPFQIAGRPYIDREHDFRMYKKPGECRSLQEERSKGGASPQMREQRAKNIETLRRWLKKNPKERAKDLARRFKKKLGVDLEPGTIRRYRAEIQKTSA